MQSDCSTLCKPLYEKGWGRGVCACASVCTRSRNELKTHAERQASFLLQRMLWQQDDVTALTYPSCLAGKMNEMGHAEGVNEDMHACTHSRLICSPAVWSDSYVITHTTETMANKFQRGILSVIVFCCFHLNLLYETLGLWMKGMEESYVRRGKERLKGGDDGLQWRCDCVIFWISSSSSLSIYICLFNC